MVPRDGPAVPALPMWQEGRGGDLLGIDALLARPAWHADALCTEYPGVNFFPLPGEDAGPAMAVCRRCSVAEECGAWAAENGVRDGVWGSVLRDARRLPRANVGRVVSSEGAPRREGVGSHITERIASTVVEPGVSPIGDIKEHEARVHSGGHGDVLHARHEGDQPPPPASCARCPMPVKKGRELCKSCERAADAKRPPARDEPGGLIARD